MNMTVSRRTSAYPCAAADQALGDFRNSTSLRLILISYDSFHTGSVEALVDPITIHEKFSHDHRFSTAYTPKGAATSLVY